MKGVNGRTRKLITNSIKLIWTACIICNVYKRVKCPYIYHLTKWKLYCQVLLWLYLYGQAISFIISLTLVTGTAKILLEYIKRREFLCDTICMAKLSLFITSSTLMESSEYPSAAKRGLRELFAASTNRSYNYPRRIK